MIGGDFAQLAHHEARQARARRLVVARRDAVVADERAGHDHALARVRGIGQDLLIAGHRGVEDEFSAGLAGGAAGAARIKRPVLESQPGFVVHKFLFNV